MNTRVEQLDRLGLSMVEAFVVLMLIVVLASVSIPAIRSGLAHSNLSDGVNGLVQQIEFARAQAAARNRAYKVEIASGSGSDRGSIHLIEGISGSCDTSNFTDDGIEPEPVSGVRLIDYSTRYPTVTIREVLPYSLSAHGLCIKPDGRVLEISSSGGNILPPSSSPYSYGEAAVTLSLVASNGSLFGVERRVVIPYNGIPRLEQSDD